MVLDLARLTVLGCRAEPIGDGSLQVHLASGTESGSFRLLQLVRCCTLQLSSPSRKAGLAVYPSGACRRVCGRMTAVKQR